MCSVTKCAIMNKHQIMKIVFAHITVMRLNAKAISILQ